MKRKAVILLVLLVGLGGVTTAVTTFWSDGFEAYSVGVSEPNGWTELNEDIETVDGTYGAEGTSQSYYFNSPSTAVSSWQNSYPYDAQGHNTLPTQLEFSYRETGSGNKGGGITLLDDNDNHILNIGTSNPQLVYTDGNGITQKNYPFSGDGYDEWTNVKILFDWDQGTYSAIWTEESTGTKYTQSGMDLETNASIDELIIVNGCSPGMNNRSNWNDGCGSATMDMWYDEFATLSEPDEPIPVFTVQQSPALTGEQLDFNSKVYDDGTITSYEWDFGSDGSVEQTGSTATQTYSTRGTKAVTLNATDNDGNEGTLAGSVLIYEQFEMDGINWIFTGDADDENNGARIDATSLAGSGADGSAYASNVTLDADFVSIAGEYYVSGADEMKFGIDGGTNGQGVNTDGDTLRVDFDHFDNDITIRDRDNTELAKVSFFHNNNNWDDFNITLDRTTGDIKVYIDGVQEASATVPSYTKGGGRFDISADSGGSSGQQAFRNFQFSGASTNSAPTFSNLQPSNNTVTNSQPTISGDVSDTDGNLDNVEVFINGTSEANLSVSGSSDSFSYQTGKSDGYYSWSIEVNDTDGATDSSAKRFYTQDTTDPTWSNFQVEDDNGVLSNNTVTSDDTLNMSADFQDNNELANAYFYVDGSPNGQSISGTTDFADFTTSALSEGQHWFGVGVDDTATNLNKTEQIYQFTVDATAPSITKNLPDRYQDEGLSIDFDADFSDGVGLKNYSLSIENSVVESASISGTSYNHSYLASGRSEGNYSYTYTVFDDAGNKGTYSNYFIVSDDPEFDGQTSSVTDDNGNDKVNSNGQLTVEANVSDGNGLAVVEARDPVDATSVTLSDGDSDGIWDATFTPANDDWTTQGQVNIYAEDSIGNSSTFALNHDVDWDTSANMIGEDFEVSGDNVSLDVTTGEDGTLEWEVAGTNQSLTYNGNAAFNGSRTLSDGIYTDNKLYFTDEEGNTDFIDVVDSNEYAVDTQNPVAGISQVKQVTNTSVEVNLTGSDNIQMQKAEVYLNSSLETTVCDTAVGDLDPFTNSQLYPQSCIGGIEDFSTNDPEVILANLNDTTYQLEVVYTDMVGQQDTVTTTFSGIDSEPPEAKDFQINASDNTLTGNKTYEVKFNVTDQSAIDRVYGTLVDNSSTNTELCSNIAFGTPIYDNDSDGLREFTCETLSRGTLDLVGSEADVLFRGILEDEYLNGFNDFRTWDTGYQWDGLWSIKNFRDKSKPDDTNNLTLQFDSNDSFNQLETDIYFIDSDPEYRLYNPDDDCYSNSSDPCIVSDDQNVTLINTDTQFDQEYRTRYGVNLFLQDQTSNLIRVNASENKTLPFGELVGYDYGDFVNGTEKRDLVDVNFPYSRYIVEEASESDWNTYDNDKENLTGYSLPLSIGTGVGEYQIEIDPEDDKGNIYGKDDGETVLVFDDTAKIRPDSIVGRIYQSVHNALQNDDWMLGLFIAGLFMIPTTLWLEYKTAIGSIFPRLWLVLGPFLLVYSQVLPYSINMVMIFVIAGEIVAEIIGRMSGSK